MHEMALVRSVLDVVLDACAGKDVRAVTSVHLTIGDVHDVVDEFIPGLFRHLARGTVAEDAVIAIHHIPLTVRCNRCGTVFRINVYREQTWVCPHCGVARDYQLNTGREFTVDSIEVEAAPADGADGASHGQKGACA